ncbi:MAG TPA: S1C family serine protease [Candidatus Bathyarchaeia archaeon]|nr:S1C family serine protease [Candidatus Bathyarchaeia archaeon]
MRKRFVIAKPIVFAVSMMITIPFDGFILPSAAIAQQQEINSNTSSSPTTTSSSNTLSLNSIFKQVENSVVQITTKTQTTNSSNQPSSNANTLGSGFVYDKQGHIITNGHVVRCKSCGCNICRWQ